MKRFLVFRYLKKSNGAITETQYEYDTWEQVASLEKTSLGLVEDGYSVKLVLWERKLIGEVKFGDIS